MFGTDAARRPRMAGLLGALLVAAAAPMATAQEGDAFALERRIVAVVGQVEPSVVSIARIRRTAPETSPQSPDPLQLQPRLPRAALDPSSPDFVPTSFGCGVIIAPADNSAQRLILTNYHVVKGGPVAGAAFDPAADDLYVQFANRRGCYASILAADPRSDLATLVIDFNALRLRPDELVPARLGDARELRKGQFVVAFGNPYAIARDGSPSAGWGMIGNFSRRPAPPTPLSESEDPQQRETLHHLGTLLQLDMRLDLGTSGGAVVNLRSELVGLTTSLAALDGYEKSAGFAVPIDRPMRRVIDALSRGHEVEYGYLGVSPNDVTFQEMQALSGQFGQPAAARVGNVFPASPASQAGVEPDDVILRVNEETVYGKSDLMREVGRMAPESLVELVLWRERTQQQLTRTVKLGKWPVSDDEGIIATVPRFAPWRGIAVDYPTGRRKFLQPPTYRQYPAVVVTELRPPSRIRDADLQPGDFISHVNEVPVQSPAEFHEAVEGARGDVVLQLIGGRRVVVRE